MAYKRKRIEIVVIGSSRNQIKVPVIGLHMNITGIVVIGPKRSRGDLLKHESL